MLQRRPLQRCPLCVSSVASYLLCVLHAVACRLKQRCMLQVEVPCCNVACCRLKQHVATLHVVGSACCMLQCCPLQPILLSVASGILSPVVSARCSAVCCMLNFRFVLSFLHVVMLPAACCNAVHCMFQCRLLHVATLPVACCNVDRCLLQRCPLHLVFSSTRRD